MVCVRAGNTYSRHIIKKKKSCTLSQQKRSVYHNISPLNQPVPLFLPPSSLIVPLFNSSYTADSLSVFLRRERTESVRGRHRRKLSYLKGCHFNFGVEVWMSGVFFRRALYLQSMFICLHALVCVCVRACVCAWRGVLITSSHTCFPRRLSLPSSHAASSKPDPATVVASPFPAVSPNPHPHPRLRRRQAGLARVQQPPLPLYHRCPSGKTSPVSCDPWEGKILAAWRMYIQVL